MNSDLKLINTYKIKVKEPSGLTNGFNGKELLCVSDKTHKVYRISEKGELLGEVPFLGVDLEGIAINPNNKCLYIAEEKNNNIVKFDYEKNTISQEFKIPQFNDKENSGIEGICYNPKQDNFFLLNEKKPGLLIVWDEKNGVSKKTKLNFAKDFSGVVYDSSLDILWIVSDDSETLSAVSLEGQLIKSFKTGIEQAEGIALNDDNSKLFIVSDKEEKLYIFQKPNIN